VNCENIRGFHDVRMRGFAARSASSEERKGCDGEDLEDATTVHCCFLLSVPVLALAF
jgi:hypothetical protein